jgi:hypothetical protein
MNTENLHPLFAGIFQDAARLPNIHEAVSLYELTEAEYEEIGNLIAQDIYISDAKQFSGYQLKSGNILDLTIQYHYAPMGRYEKTTDYQSGGELKDITLSEFYIGLPDESVCPVLYNREKLLGNI